MKVCSVDGCDELHDAKGLCSGHYARLRRYGDPLAQPVSRQNCSVEGCDRSYYGRGFCSPHYWRWKRSGAPDATKPIKTSAKGKSKCSVPECERNCYGNGFCHAHYRRWKNHGTPMPDRPIVNKAAMPKVCSVPDCSRRTSCNGLCSKHASRMRVHGSTGDQFGRKGYMVNDSGYKLISINGKMYREHRVVMEKMIGRPLKACETVHHKNGDKLDNRPENLELWRSRHCAGQRLEDKVEYAKQLLADYEGVDIKSAVRVSFDSDIKTGVDGTTKGKNGYRVICRKGSPFAPKSGFIAEHRFVMSVMLGRKLRRDEFVHHLNGDRDDNRPQNLELWTSSQPKGARVVDLVHWAKEFLASYGLAIAT